MRIATRCWAGRPGSSSTGSRRRGARDGRCRLLCATRVHGFPASVEAINQRLCARLRGGAAEGLAGARPQDLPPGTPVLVQRNDYVRGLYNGDQGVVVRVQSEDTAPRPMAVFSRQGSVDALPLDAFPAIAPAFAMTVHKAQGSEFDHVGLVFPDSDLPIVTRELVYTAITRARRSVLLVGARDLVARAMSRTIERHSGVAERLLLR